ncbi:MAG TPA: hypothetical protein VK909_20865 [Anaerolineales bacterium]|nr:hypothetical protein [Anaerolineales bacterium]
MDSDKAIIGALIFVALIIGANLIMYAVARGWAKSGGSDWMSAFKQGLSKPLDNEANRSIDELHQKIEALQKTTKKEV